MELEIGDYSPVLLEVLWQGILNLLFNHLTSLSISLTWQTALLQVQEMHVHKPYMCCY
jgi:hypothetical protein